MFFFWCGGDEEEIRVTTSWFPIAYIHFNCNQKFLLYKSHLVNSKFSLFFFQEKWSWKGGFPWRLTSDKVRIQQTGQNWGRNGPAAQRFLPKASIVVKLAESRDELNSPRIHHSRLEPISTL